MSEDQPSGQSGSPRVNIGNIVNSVGVAADGGTVHVDYNERWRPDPPREIPGLPPYIVPRREIAEPLLRQMRLPNQAIIAVTGPAGIGKTTLTAVLANELRDRFPDGLLWNEFTGRSGEVYDRVGGCLGRLGADPRQLHSREDYIHTLRTLLDSRRLLLVLDNWHDNGLDLRYWLPSIGANCILVTTEDNTLALDIADHHVAVTAFTEEGARQLLRSVAGQLLNSLPDELVGRLIQQTAGIPALVINLGKQIKREARFGIDALRTWAEKVHFDGTDPEQLYEFGVSRLDKQASRAFEVLGLLAPLPIEPDLLAAVLKIDIPSAQHLLQQLENTSLVEVTDESVFQMQLPVHQYAKKRWSAHGSRSGHLAILVDTITRRIDSYDRGGPVPDTLIAHAEAVFARCIDARAWENARRLASLSFRPFTLSGNISVWYRGDYFLAQFNGTNWASGTFTASNLGAAQWNGCNFASSSLLSVILSGSQFNGCDFSSSTFSSVKLQASQFNSCSFSSATLFDSDLRGAIFDECSFTSTRLLRCDLRGAVFRRCAFSDYVFADTALKETIFQECSDN